MTTYSLQQIYASSFSLDGQLWETLTRSGNLPAETVWVHTFEDQGFVNNGAFIAPQTDGLSIAFAAGQTSINIPVTILDNGAGETFSFDILRNAGDSDLNYLAHTTFTIPGGSGGGGGSSAPVVYVHDINLAPQSTISGSSLISTLSNPSGDSITQYAFWDGGTGNGHFTLNGIAQADGQWIVESTANLGAIQYISGSVSGSETLYVEVYDATRASWSASASLTATTAAVLSAVTVNVNDVTVNANASISGSSLIASVSNPGGDSITQYAFWDGGSGNGHFTLNSITESDGQWIVVNSSSLSSIQYIGGSASGSETLYIEAYDATSGVWSLSSSLTATTTAIISAITVNVQNISVNANASISGSALVASVTNSTNDTISGYAFWDGGSGNGHFTLNGAAQADGQWIVVTSSSLSSIQYLGGPATGSETLYIEAYDATKGVWSAASSFTATTIGQQGNQTFHAGGGDQGFDGGVGHNTVIFDGAVTQYTFTTNGDGSVTTTDSVVGRDGIDVLLNIEFLQFTDQTVFVENANSANIARLYSAAFDRAPDTAGLSFWEDIYSTHISAAVKSSGYYIALAQTNDGSGVTIADGFIQSGEFQHLYGTLTDGNFIIQMYQNVLGRAPDTAGYNFWLSQMDGSAHTTQAMVLVGFAESPENVAKTAAGWLISV